MPKFFVHKPFASEMAAKKARARAKTFGQSVVIRKKGSKFLVGRDAPSRMAALNAKKRLNAFGERGIKIIKK